MLGKGKESNEFDGLQISFRALEEAGDMNRWMTENKINPCYSIGNAGQSEVTSRPQNLQIRAIPETSYSI